MFFLFTALALTQTLARAETKVIHAGKVLVRADQPVLHEQSIIVRNGKITNIISGFIGLDDELIDDENGKIINLRDMFVLPGLIDSHTHITQSPATFSSKRKSAEVSLSEADRALMGVVQARKTLQAGFTTVRNVGGFRGGNNEAIFALRNAINHGDIAGPRIFAAGQAISIVGGHSDTHGYLTKIDQILTSSGVCTGVDQCTLAVRTQIKNGADLIKVTVTGGVTDTATTGLGQQFTDAELNAIVEAGHMLGRKVTGHAHSAKGIQAALKAGFDSIDHGTFTDKATAKLFKKNNAFFVTTLTAPSYLLETANKPGSSMPPVIKSKLEYAMTSLMKSTFLAYKSGIKIVLGTDSGVSPHGENANELLLLVEMGMSERDAILAATMTAAELLGLTADIGSIEPKKNADIIATCTSPLADISTLKNISVVIKDGKIIKHIPCSP